MEKRVWSLGEAARTDGAEQRGGDKQKRKPVQDEKEDEFFPCDGHMLFI